MSRNKIAVSETCTWQERKVNQEIWQKMQRNSIRENTNTCRTGRNMYIEGNRKD